MALKAKQIEHAKVGMHADGGGLYLRVQASGAKSWIFRFQLRGRRREMGIGTLDERTAPEARAEAARLTLMVRAGVDPIETKRALEDAQRPVDEPPVFRTVAAEYIAAQRAGWRNVKHAAQWSATLETYAYPVIGHLPVAEITPVAVLETLRPIWASVPETASRVRSRIELVLRFAKAQGLRSGENPAAWRGNLDAMLPAPRKVRAVRHHPALPYAEMPAFMTALRAAGGFGARALEFAILTAARSGEVRLAGWSEVDLEARLWTVPAARMKAGREHRVPLSVAAVELLDRLPRLDETELIFPGADPRRPMSDMSIAAVIKRMNAAQARWIDPQSSAPIVPHGFRSTFRDWVAEQTHHPGELAEMALAHTIASKVESAYRRGDMLERRRTLMQEWADYLREPARRARGVTSSARP